MDGLLKFMTEMVKAPVTVWRAFIMMSCLVFAAHIAWACGWLPGIPGFAMAQDVEANKAAIAEVTNSVNCNAILSEIKRLRSELRDNETKMIEAQQAQNQPMILHLSGVISEIDDLLADEIVKRNMAGCTG